MTCHVTSWQLFIKNTIFHKVIKICKWRLTPVWCQKVNEVGDESPIEVHVNGD